MASVRDRLELQNGFLMSQHVHNNKGNHSNGHTQYEGKVKNRARKKKYYKDIGWKQSLINFTQDTTLHGIRYTTIESVFIVRRILWGLIVFAACAIFCYYLIGRVGDYLKFEKNVNVEVNYADSIEFPAVTICNQNRFRLTAATKGGWYDDIKILYPEKSKGEGRACKVGSEFRCSTGLCIAKNLRCDMFPDCLDGSDELNCKPCPHMTSTIEAESKQIIFNKTFQLQHYKTRAQQSQYIILSSTALLKLFYNNDTKRWEIYNPEKGNEFNFLKIYPTDGREYPEDSSSDWIMIKKDGSQVKATVKLECHTPPSFNFSLDSIVTEPLQHLALDTLYEAGAHKMDEMIDECTWKGNPCTGALHEEYTDLGLCYRFTLNDLENMIVENSGPAYGLSMKINIEEYEYTKSTQNGLGVQILLHAPSDIPVMGDASFAISPGLYSMVSIDRTLVENLEYPWGNCSSPDLIYYDEPYTINKCKMECDNILARSRCGCRDINMPDNGAEEVCHIDPYVSCVAPVFVQEHLYSNYCGCATPCLEKNFIPTLSFATISADETTIDEREAEHLRHQLSTARETRYRVTDSFHRQTMKMFFTIITELEKLIDFVMAASKNVQDETDAMLRIVAEVSTDCIKFTEIEHELIKTLENKQEASTLFDVVFYSKINIDLKNIQMIVNDNVKAYQEAVPEIEAKRTACLESYPPWNKSVCNQLLPLVNGNVKCDEYKPQDVNIHFNFTYEKLNVVDFRFTYENLTKFYNFNLGLFPEHVDDLTYDFCAVKKLIQSVCEDINMVDNQTEALWEKARDNHCSGDPLHTRLKYNLLNHFEPITASIESLKILANSTILQGIASLPDFPDFILYEDMLKPIIPLLRSTCDWCMSKSTDDMTFMEKLKDRSLKFFEDTVVTWLDTTQDAINAVLPLIESGDILSADEQTLALFNRRLDQTLNLFSDQGILMNQTKNSLYAVSSEYIKEVLRLLDPKCMEILPNVHRQYEGIQLQTRNALWDLEKFAKAYRDDLDEYWKKYNKVDMTLEEVAKKTDFERTLATLTSKWTVISALVNDYEISLGSLYNIITNINYWFMAQTDQKHLSRDSHLWRHFDIINPDYTAPRQLFEDLIYRLDESLLMNASEINNYWSGLYQFNAVFKKGVQERKYHSDYLLNHYDAYLKSFIKSLFVGSDFFSKNFIQLDIFYTELSEQRVVQQKAYTYQTLLSEVGGLMGLIVGASCLTIIEFIDFFVYTAVIKCINKLYQD